MFVYKSEIPFFIVIHIEALLCSSFLLHSFVNSSMNLELFNNTIVTLFFTKLK